MFLAYQTAYEIFFLLDHGVTDYICPRDGHRMDSGFARKLVDFKTLFGLQMIELGKRTGEVIAAAEEKSVKPDGKAGRTKNPRSKP